MRIPIILFGLAVCLGACGGSSGGGSDPSCTTPSSGTTMKASEQALADEVLRLVNVERADAGLQAVVWHASLAQVAFEHSWDMATRNFFDHTNPCGEEAWDRVNRAGISWSAIAENIAKGQTTAAGVMASWMSSPGHRANILDIRMTHCSIGVYEPALGGTLWTMLLIQQ